MKNKELQEITESRTGLKMKLVNDITKTNFFYQTILNRDINIKEFRDIHSSTVDFSNPEDCMGLIPVVQNMLKVGKQDSIVILVDSDVDGLVSAVFLYNYLRLIGYHNIQFIQHEGKQHGLHDVMYQILDIKPDLLLLPDSSSNDRLEHKVLEANNINFIILDHHEVNYDITTTENTDLIGHIANNNMVASSRFNHELTGVGMVLAFCQQLDKALQVDNANKFLYLFAIGQIADASNVSDREIRFYMLKGFNEMPRLQIPIGDTSEMSPNKLSFGLIPGLNAVMRIGSIQEKQDVIRLLTSQPVDHKITITKMEKQPNGKRKRVKKPCTFPEYVANLLKRMHTKQNNYAKNFSKKHMEDVVDFGRFTILNVKEKDLKFSSLTGMISMQLVNKYSKPNLFVWEDEDGMCHGSGRGLETVMKDFKQYCNDTGLFEFADGHASAFGCEISADNLGKLPHDLSSVHQPTYNIDYLYLEDNAPDNKSIRHYSHELDLFGGIIKEPVLGFLGACVHSNTYQIRGSYTRFKVAGTQFVIYRTPEVVLEALNHAIDTNSSVYLDMTGHPILDTHMSIATPCIVVDHVAVSSKVEVEKELTYSSFVF